LAKLDDEQSREFYNQACKGFQKSIEINPDKQDALYNLGFALEKLADMAGVDAEKYYQDACTKYQRITEISPDDHDILDCLGVTLLKLAKLKDGQEKEKLYQEAEKVLLKAEAIKRGEGAYNLSCLFALRSNENKCQEWLKVGEEAKNLPDREHAMKDDDLASVRDKDWFKTIRWKDE
jgi:tetratricopeptide (TPR) repeat protein